MFNENSSCVAIMLAEYRKNIPPLRLPINYLVCCQLIVQLHFTPFLTIPLTHNFLSPPFLPLFLVPTEIATLNTKHQLQTKGVQGYKLIVLLSFLESHRDIYCGTKGKMTDEITQLKLTLPLPSCQL